MLLFNDFFFESVIWNNLFLSWNSALNRRIKLANNKKATNKMFNDQYRLHYAAQNIQTPVENKNQSNEVKYRVTLFYAPFFHFALLMPCEKRKKQQLCYTKLNNVIHRSSITSMLRHLLLFCLLLAVLICFHWFLFLSFCTF